MYIRVLRLVVKRTRKIIFKSHDNNLYKIYFDYYYYYYILIFRMPCRKELGKFLSFFFSSHKKRIDA